LRPVFDVYDVIDQKIKTCKKPIYAILPSVVNVKEEIANFIAKSNIAFQDEVLFGKALGKIYNQPKKEELNHPSIEIDKHSIRKIIDEFDNGYLPEKQAFQLLQAAQINVVPQFEVNTKKELDKVFEKLTFPVVQKVIGPLHKSDIGGVILNVKTQEEVCENFDKLMRLKEANAVSMQPMKKGIELFIGAKKEGDYPPIIVYGLGGIFVEVLKDIQVGMIPLSEKEALKMIEKLKAFPILKGVRGQEGININSFVESILKIATLLEIAPEIVELDINPLIATTNEITAVDVRIRIEKN
jgi:acetyltransferase